MVRYQVGVVTRSKGYQIKVTFRSYLGNVAVMSISTALRFREWAPVHALEIACNAAMLETSLRMRSTTMATICRV